ncbi:hypothetical protein LVY72_08740 [Arthrobacter sp. I2-34]|uniref:Acetoacetate decarboxylase n=1 Tax=Arthrobacter hankyongi TaxID=2904801 RepID=A0ABS9L5Z2_9MICC|nr:hypothetical protein [Arthrobacter hankyongi]MCG2622003.1 hypothetical protein [Arthrobacter hankyongi]
MKSPRTLAAGAERLDRPASGPDEQFSGYAVTGLPFSSGHILALRRFPASSLGPGYTSVWLRNPAGTWAMYVTVDPALSCPRYFGSAVGSTWVQPISITWRGDHDLAVGIGGDVDLAWELRLGSTPATLIFSAMAGTLPEKLWRSPAFLRAAGSTGGRLLRSGRIALTGLAPNGQRFSVRPKRLWLVKESSARLRGQDLGRPGALPVQARLGGLLIPQRGFFMAGTAIFEPARGSVR